MDDDDESVRSCAALILWQMGEEGMDALGKKFSTEGGEEAGRKT